jgi:hypothetical protein
MIEFQSDFLMSVHSANVQLNYLSKPRPLHGMSHGIPEKEMVSDSESGRTMQTYSIILLYSVLPHPIFVILEKFQLNSLFADWTRYGFCLIARRHNDIKSSQFSITLDNICGSRRLGIQWSMSICALAF